MPPKLHPFSLDRIAVGPADSPLPLVTQSAVPDCRPFLHPLRSPDGSRVLTEDEPSHHPWQHGLYIGLNDVNGTGFWTEHKHPAYQNHDGHFEPEPLAPPVVSGEEIAWGVTTRHLGPDREPLLRETQHWTARFSERYYLLDLVWRLEALTAIRIGRHNYGGLFLRVPFEQGCMTLRTSEGATQPPDAEGKPARWAAVSPPAGDGTPAGIAILSHPSNTPWPELWRVDDEYGINPCPFRSAPVELPPGGASVRRYRVAVFSGFPDADWLDDLASRL